MSGALIVLPHIPCLTCRQKAVVDLFLTRAERDLALGRVHSAHIASHMARYEAARLENLAAAREAWFWN